MIHRRYITAHVMTLIFIVGVSIVALINQKNAPGTEPLPTPSAPENTVSSTPRTTRLTATTTNPVQPSGNATSSNSRIFIKDVPFSAQAPFGEWDDPRQQDGCEEASALMAIYWAEGKTLTTEQAKKEIIAISLYQEKAFGEYRDTSAEDTLQRIIQGYFGFTPAQVHSAITVEDIIAELEKGNLVIVPANGQLLNNPHFTPPGPLRHMLVIRGYDNKTREFITNDPGTRYGKEFRYNRDVLFTAIVNYPSGYHQDLAGADKAMIVVQKVGDL